VRIVKAFKSALVLQMLWRLVRISQRNSCLCLMRELLIHTLFMRTSLLWRLLPLNLCRGQLERESLF
jgi:hypothetical protein